MRLIMTIFLQTPAEAPSINSLDPIKMKSKDETKDEDPQLPELHSDDTDLNLRDIVGERLFYGVRSSDAELARIRDRGYAAYFMIIAKSPRRIGGRSFKKLRDAGRLDLTTEYILFHRFRDQLDRDIRQRIAAILAESVSHPHAKWESRAQS
jgi:hypothetical protein